MLRNNASGPEIGLPGRILAGLLPGKHRNRPSRRPSAGRRANLGALPVAVRPKSGPEGRCQTRKHCCVTFNIPLSWGHPRPGSGRSLSSEKIWLGPIPAGPEHLIIKPAVLYVSSALVRKTPREKTARKPKQLLYRRTQHHRFSADFARLKNTSHRGGVVSCCGDNNGSLSGRVVRCGVCMFVYVGVCVCLCMFGCVYVCVRF